MSQYRAWARALGQGDNQGHRIAWAWKNCVVAVRKKVRVFPPPNGGVGRKMADFLQIPIL